MKILIVDDDVPTTQAIKNAIDWSLFSIDEVLTANSVNKAKSIILEVLPEIILCDIEMPKNTGLDLIQWVRESKIDSRFLFLTCHEDFLYAAEAIKYAADDYILKPFEVERVQISLAKVVEKIAYQQHLKEYSDIGQRWLGSAKKREAGFWRDLLFNGIQSSRNAIRREMQHRGVQCDANALFRLVLYSIRESQPEENEWDPSTFRYAFCNMSSEIVLGNVEFPQTLDYYEPGRYLFVAVIQDMALSDIDEKCRRLTDMCKRYLQCDMTCYIGREAAIENLAGWRIQLEEADSGNIIKRGRVITVDKTDSPQNHNTYVFDSEPLRQLLFEERGVEAVNKLRSDLEKLSAHDQLDLDTMRSIRHDYLQMIYAILYNNGIHAHSLFTDNPSRKLFQASEGSVYDLMKWVSFVTLKAFQCIRELREADTLVDRVKRFIGENYTRKLTRDDIAASVFLSPDYISKIFRSETGVHIKDYVNELRISKAKQLLSDGRRNVSEVASDVGFDNFSYFSTLFKKSTGVSPSDYKK